VTSTRPLTIHGSSGCSGITWTSSLFLLPLSVSFILCTLLAGDSTPCLVFDASFTAGDDEEDEEEDKDDWEEDNDDDKVVFDLCLSGSCSSKSDHNPANGLLSFMMNVHASSG